MLVKGARDQAARRPVRAANTVAAAASLIHRTSCVGRNNRVPTCRFDCAAVARGRSPDELEFTTMSAVVFGGAGVAKPLGYPLTTEILPQIQELVGRLSEEHPDRVAFNVGIKRLLPGIHVAGVATLPTITEVLSLLDHMIAEDVSPAPGVTPAWFAISPDRAIVITDCQRHWSQPDLALGVCGACRG